MRPIAADEWEFPAAAAIDAILRFAGAAQSSPTPVLSQAVAFIGSQISRVCSNGMRNGQIAIVGGGPSGAMCGLHLAQAGFDVTLYEERLAWEKPCGGGLTHKAVLRYPFLLDNAHPKK